MQPQRKTTRLGGYDYRRAGAYFCTVCVHRQWRRREVWGRVESDAMKLNRFGALVWDCWNDLPRHHDGLELDAFVVMPNHIHALVLLTQAGFEEPQRAAFGPPAPNSLSTIMGSFKSAVTRGVNRLRSTPIHPLWQERFYERIVRDETELNATRLYIHNNPAQWQRDRCHPAHPQFDAPWRGIAPDDIVS